MIAATLTTSSIAGLAKNGGFTRSHALLAGSQAFNAAINGTSTDQRGFTVSDGTRDIGAIEDQSPVVTAPADIRIEATGLNTPVTQAMFGMATVNDPDQTGIIAAANNTATFNLGPHTVTWSATDNHGHTDSDTQLVTLEDTTPPTISLNGSSTILLKIGDSYNDAGATATDIIWGDVTPSIVVTNPVNTSIAGTYTVNYRASDPIANISNATRTVKVRATIGGSVSGLTGTNTLKIYDGTNPFLFSSYLTLGNGQFTFINPVQSGDGYTVIITAQPASGNVTCSISNNTGSVTTSNITNISVVCFNPNEFYIGGMASGLINGNPVTLALGAQNLQISSNAAFVFPNPLLNGNTYEVTIDSLPNTPTQTCELLNPTGTITSNDVMDVEINCTTIDMVFDDGFE